MQANSTAAFNSGIKSITDLEDQNMLVNCPIESTAKDPFNNLLLQRRFVLKHKFDSGQFGQIYIAHDLHHGSKEVLVKIQTDHILNKLEYKVY